MTALSCNEIVPVCLNHFRERIDVAHSEQTISSQAGTIMTGDEIDEPHISTTDGKLITIPPINRNTDQNGLVSNMAIKFKIGHDYKFTSVTVLHTQTRKEMQPKNAIFSQKFESAPKKTGVAPKRT